MLAPFNLPQFLRSQPLFTDVDDAALERLASACRLRRFDRGEPVLWAGQPCDAFFIVARGQVRLYMTAPNGNEKVIELVGPGRSFAEALVFLQCPCPINAQALTDVLLLEVPRQAVLHELQCDTGFALRMLSGMSRRVHGLVQDVQASALQSGLQRIVGYLLRDVDPDQPGPALISLPAAKATVASLLSLTPEYFSRVLHELEAAGLLQVERRDIRLPDPAALARHAAGQC
ncbi:MULTISPECIES: Crp/Fnr family transcriptional regulator [Roseateles]|uniref:CRP-like cAMP-binding protein n=1 Tax=Pelomonas aquatica TaxID=431058 RepID=A0ABU1ZFC0_9BURK|nr:MULTISPECIES: Crp/Fnr family transcriptional regulator [Roseateles]KQY82453.1 Crp/Fnr family transcriptional regulator [Pelomonas sp. Root1444]MDR7299312.1 CRP-like cAMP-binding protein [Pelomonas aquatica]